MHIISRRYEDMWKSINVLGWIYLIVVIAFSKFNDRMSAQFNGDPSFA